MIVPSHAQTRKLVSLIPDRNVLMDERVAFVADLAFDVTEQVQPLEGEAPAIATESSGGAAVWESLLEVAIAGPLRRTLNRRFDVSPPLLIAAAGGHFSSDIDKTTTIIVTGTTDASVAMDAAVGKHDGYTIALRHKLEASRNGYVSNAFHSS